MIIIIIPVFCKVCNWTGQAIINKKGFSLIAYKCPECGNKLKKVRGTLIYSTEYAVFKRQEGAVTYR